MKEDWKYEKIYGGEGKITTSLDDALATTPYRSESEIAAHKRENYGHGLTGEWSIGEVLSLNPQSVLDVGCGYNEYCNSLYKEVWLRNKKIWYEHKSLTHDMLWDGEVTTNGKIPVSEKSRWKRKSHPPNKELITEACETIRQRITDIVAIGLDCSCPGADVLAPANDLPFYADSFDVITSFDTLEHIAEEEMEQVISEMHRVTKKYVLLQIDRLDHGTKIDGESLHVTMKDVHWWNNIIEQKFDIKRAYGSMEPNMVTKDTALDGLHVILAEKK